MGKSGIPSLHDGWTIQQVFYVLFGVACFAFLIIALVAFGWKLWRRGRL